MRGVCVCASVLGGAHTRGKESFTQGDSQDNKSEISDEQTVTDALNCLAL